jgi:general nucleoside transport system ATP-binding protein
MTGVGPFLEARGIVKRFGPLLANDVATFAVHPGEVVALLGENGAGKSTLCKILVGYYRADAGEIRVAGRPVAITSPREARRLGIGMVFQNFSLIPALTVWENVALFVADLPWVIRPAALIRRMRRDAERLHLRVDPRLPVGRLAVGDQQKVEILKQLLGGARVLILDEPTKVLAPQEAQGLFRTLAALRNEGYGFIFISHKLHEAMACADRIWVMRQGRIVATLRAHEASEATLLDLMFADASAPRIAPAATAAPGEMLLELEGIATAPEVGCAVLRDLSLCLRAGEILGVAGVAGNGQPELADVILGLRRPSNGVKRLWGANATRWSAARIRERGVASIPDDPLALAVVPALTVRDNLVLGSGRTYRAGLDFDWERLASAADRCVVQLGFPALAYHARAGVLSGGNLQRLVLTRELSRDPKLIVALYPSRGLDARSAESLRGLLGRARAAGAAVLLVSEDLDELFAMSNRLIVLRNGRVAGSFLPAAFDAEAVGSCMMGAADAA